MKKENTILIVTISVILILVLCSYIGVKISSGVDPPCTVIESESMQHSDKSEIGVIDTGDMIIVKSPSKTEIVTFVEGYDTGYESFGNYGSVIVYYRNIGNPVIHRAIIWLENNGSTWSAPALEKYPAELWSCTSGNDWNSMSGTLKITLKSDYRTIDISINLNNMLPVSGYVTMGDYNGIIDQSTSISQNKLITPEGIKSVAWKEIPWIGAIKLILKGNIDIINSKVPNTVPNMVASLFTIILSIISIGYLIDGCRLLKLKTRK